jgi:predicted N-formylglutamate amidohydrolase
MVQSWEDVAGTGDSRVLLIADHASARIPPDIDLGIAPHLLATHIAVDIGVAGLGRALCAALGCPGIFGGVSRLVVDFNREEDAPHLVPIASDGHAIPGNAIGHAARLARIARYWRPYHDRVAAQIAAQAPALLVSLHSFTPKLATAPDEERPWQVGILYNNDDRAARIAIPLLAAQGIVVGDQLPYSGKLLNATMDRHGESNHVAYLGIEMRQDLIDNLDGIAEWTAILAPVIEACFETCACRAPI